MFYTADEAAKRLSMTEDKLKGLVRAGTLREFRDAGKVNYKVEDIDAMVGSVATATETENTSSASASGDIVLEPVEDSGIELAPAPSDVVSLEESAAGATSSGTVSGSTAAEKASEDTAVPSVGINVFDDDDLDEQVDPLAQTAVTDIAGLGMDAAGSGSGILDLTRESDDTSLGRELLEEIYTDDDDRAGESGIEVGADTQAGLEDAAEPDTVDETEAVAVDQPPVAAAPKAVPDELATGGVDAVTSGLTALLAVAVVVMWFAGLGAAALVRGITPSLLESVYSNLWMFAAGAVVVAGIAGGVTYLLVKRSG